MVDLNQLKKLREETGAPVMEAKRALEDSGSFDQAKEALKKMGIEKAAKKEGRTASQGMVGSYVHSGGRIGAVVALACETDFVARTEDFKKLLTEITLQVAAMNPGSVAELLEQNYIREPDRRIRDLLIETAAKVGENVVVKDFRRLEI